MGFTMYDPDCPSFFKAPRVFMPVIRELSVSVHRGEIVALVGASGSGKTLLADCLMGICAPNARISGRIWYDGIEQDTTSLARLRGNGISLVPQSVSFLDPLMKAGKQVQGVSRRGRREKKDRRVEQEVLFEHYGLPDEAALKYPHELSGGMARRVLLCGALIESPRLIIADEPTPGLDLELACAALKDFRSFAREGGGVLLITHDIELALLVAHRVAVFNEGSVVEETAVANFRSPDLLKHPFSKALWHALPEHDFTEAWERRSPERRPSEGGSSESCSPADAQQPRRQASNTRTTSAQASNTRTTSAQASSARASNTQATSAQASNTQASNTALPALLTAHAISYRWPSASTPVLDALNLSVASNERLALSAPSGAGKTSLCKILAGYLKPQKGVVLLEGKPLPRREVCPVQLIGQHPELSCDPSMRMRDLLEEACTGRGSNSKHPNLMDPETQTLLEQLSIPGSWLSRFPHELSGGELQRFCIARALLARPRFIIADEATTMLDTVTQAQVWRLLLSEAERAGFGLIIVSHSPTLVRRLATRVQTIAL
jgi:ABC-type glutathione transport system ATPase component